MEQTFPSLFFEEFASPAQKKRLKILECSLRITIRDGLHELSLSKIAKESKIPKSLVLYHFPDLYEAQLYLFKVVARSGIEITQKNMSGVKSALGQLEVIASSAFEWAVKYPDYGRYFLLMHHFASVDQRFAKINKESVETGCRRISDCLDEIYKRKLPKSELLLQASALHSILSMSVLKMITAHDYDNIDDYLKIVEFSFGKILGKDVHLNLPALSH